MRDERKRCLNSMERDISNCEVKHKKVNKSIQLEIRSQIINKKNLKNVLKIRNKTLQQAGITIVALVVTIIILLILAGITIGSLSDWGIIGKAKDAVNTYRKAESEENNAIKDMKEA